jgi:hypothetical protein
MCSFSSSKEKAQAPVAGVSYMCSLCVPLAAARRKLKRLLQVYPICAPYVFLMCSFSSSKEKAQAPVAGVSYMCSLCVPYVFL